MGKQRWEESERRRKEVRRSEERKNEKKEDAGALRGKKAEIHWWFVAPEGRKVGSLKRRVRSHVVRWDMQNCTSLWRESLRREAHFQVKVYKTLQLRTLFKSCDVKKMHAVVARSTFSSQNVQNTPTSDHFGSWEIEKAHAVVTRSTCPSQNVQNPPRSAHFWKLRDWKSGRRSGPKHISKSKV